MFALEDKDQKVLKNPENVIINTVGHILFVETADLGVVGTGTVLPTGENEFELKSNGSIKKKLVA